MAKEAIMQVRMDITLKNDAEELFKRMGTSFSEAIRIFAKQSVEFGTFPFTIRTKTNNNRGLGIAKGKLSLPDNFDDYDDEIEKMFYRG